MPWREVSAMSQRYEFVMLASQEGANVSALCRSFGISRTKGYKWLARFAAEGARGLEDRSRRPRSSPGRTAAAVERRVQAVIETHPTWGGRKVRNYLLARGLSTTPAASTITDIKHRQGLISDDRSAKSKPFIRFEHDAPNKLLQLDFKGHFAVDKGRCHPLTLIDDHSRYAVALEACADERRETVQDRLTRAFRRYGLPERMTMDNGPPWGSDADHPTTALTLWLMRLGIRVSHSRPYHPQTQGKNERFNRTLKEDVMPAASFGGSTIARLHSTAGARFTTSRDRTMRSAARSLPAATHPARASSRNSCRRSPIQRVPACARFSTAAASAIRDASCSCPRLFVATPSLSSRGWKTTACSMSSSAPLRSPRST